MNDLSQAQRITKLVRQRDAALSALDEIAARPTFERNPDGIDQAAETMALLAKEHAAKIRRMR